MSQTPARGAAGGRAAYRREVAELACERRRRRRRRGWGEKEKGALAPRMHAQRLEALSHLRLHGWSHGRARTRERRSPLVSIGAAQVWDERRRRGRGAMALSHE